MSDNSDDPEVQLHDDKVGDVNWNSPVRIQTSSVVPLTSASVKGTALHPSRSHNNNNDGLSKLLTSYSPTPRGPTVETMMS